MTNSIELKSMVYRYLKSSNVESLISGEIYLDDSRPLNSKKQDIVVGSLSVNNSVLQNSVVLVNTFIPNVRVGGNDKPNYTKLLEITNYLAPLFKELYIKKDRLYLDIEYVTDYKVQNREEHVSVIRLITRKTQ